jgi:polyhydroxybutyrate depolymerase
VARSLRLRPGARPFALMLLVVLAGACGDAAEPVTTAPAATTSASSTTTAAAPATTASTTTAAPATTITTLPAVAPLVVDGPGRYEAEVLSGGLVRRFVLFVPDALAEPAPLVLVFHGFTRGPEDAESQSDMSALAAEHGFVAVYPAGTGFPRRWLSGAAQGGQDVAFARDLVALISGAVAIDLGRVYAAGMSNGGGMAARLACDAADLVAAIGPVAAAYPAGPCEPSRPVPVVAFHGTADPIVPYEGRGEALLPVEGVMAGWVERNGCDPAPVVAEVAAEVTLLAWDGCTGGADVWLYRVAEGRHGWPGSGDTSPWGATTDAVSASALLWEFFAAHPMP